VAVSKEDRGGPLVSRRLREKKQVSASLCVPVWVFFFLMDGLSRWYNNLRSSRLLEIRLFGELVLVVQPGICYKMNLFSLSSLPIHWMSGHIPSLLLPCSVYADKALASSKERKMDAQTLYSTFVCIAVGLNNPLLPPTNPWWASRADLRDSAWRRWKSRSLERNMKVLSFTWLEEMTWLPDLLKPNSIPFFFLWRISQREPWSRATVSK